MDFSNYLFRAHMVGKIITPNKPLTENQQKTFVSLSERLDVKGLTKTQDKTFTSLKYKKQLSETISLSDGAKKILSELSFAERFGRKIEINSPKLTKGIDVEKDSRDILSRVSGLFLTASTERKRNDFVTGAIDIEPSTAIIDIKSSWSWESFTKILQDKPNEIYLRQLDSYMDLWGLDESLLIHILTDTPFRLVDSELKRMDWQKNILSVDGDVRDESIDDVKKLISNHLFSRKALEAFCKESAIIHIEWFNDFVEIEEKNRVHMIPHSFDKQRIEQRNESVILAREYMKNSTPMNNLTIIK